MWNTRRDRSNWQRVPEEEEEEEEGKKKSERYLAGYGCILGVFVRGKC
jgi:heme-degrading monooxygenase HmoA